MKHLVIIFTAVFSSVFSLHAATTSVSADSDTGVLKRPSNFFKANAAAINEVVQTSSGGGSMSFEQVDSLLQLGYLTHLRASSATIQGDLTVTGNLFASGAASTTYALVFNLTNATGNFVLKGLNGSTGALFFKFNTKDVLACQRPSGAQVPAVYYIDPKSGDTRRWVRMSNVGGIPRTYSLYSRGTEPLSTPLGAVLVIRGLTPSALHQWSVTYQQTDKNGYEDAERTTSGDEIYHPVFPQLVPENLAP